MGLDISLYEREEAEADEKYWADWEALYARKEAGEFTEEEWEAERKALSRYVRASEKDDKSRTNPEHMFTRRYLRSSYNEGGFNSVAGNFGGHDLYWIFEPLKMDFDEGGGWLREEHIDDLRLCRDRAVQVAMEIAEWDRIMVTEFRGPLLGSQDHLWSKLPSQEEVLEWARGELTKDQTKGFGEGGYSCAKGSVFPNGFEIHAITMGAPRFSFDGLPTVYGVYRADEDTFKFYQEAAHITAEFCEEAIALIQRDGSVSLSWSG